MSKPIDYDLLKVRIDKDYNTLTNILSEPGASSDKIAAIEYVLERLLQIELPPSDRLINPEESSLSYLQAVKRQLLYTRQELQTGMWLRMPQEAAILHRKLFPTPIGEEAVQTQERWNEAYRLCVERGGPWRHHDCGEVFPMPPFYPPVCPKCDLNGWNRLLDAYRHEKTLGSYKDLKAKIEEAAGAEPSDLPMTTFVPQEQWPHRCDRCGGLAYKGLNLVICKDRCDR